ncbi:MAG: SMP-30/gluconolactonase/LRE family protein [Amaricoccus sp.]
MQATVFDDTICELGEGPIWAEGRLFWFDIPGQRLHARDEAGATRSWHFGERVSAAGRLREGGLVIASETGLWRFDADSGEWQLIAAMEADDPTTRSNDGRADRQGGFWIGTMGKKFEKGAGALYRLYRGEIRLVRTGLTIPNAICFAPDGSRGYFSDGNDKCIRTWALDAHGWPRQDPETFFDFGPLGGSPDGAIVDSEGALWCANWGGGRVLRILPDGRIDAEIALPVRQPTCPAFGPALDRLYITSAREGLDAAALAAQPLAGAVFQAPIAVPGLAEPFVDLD